VAQEDFAQITRHVVDPIQHDYAVIRPLVLFSETAAARSLETGVERTVVGDKATRFIIEGMLGLADKRPGAAGRKGHVYPDAVAASILYLKQLYAPIHWRAIVRIVARKFGYKTNHHTLKRFLARHGSPTQLELNRTPFSDEEVDLWSARDAVVMKALALVLAPYLPFAKPCAHLKGHGGLKGAVRQVLAKLPQARFILKSDVQSDSASIDHHLLLTRLAEHIADDRVLDLIGQYLRRCAERRGLFWEHTKGMALGSSLSPIIGAFFLSELDAAGEVGEGVDAEEADLGSIGKGPVGVERERSVLRVRPSAPGSCSTRHGAKTAFAFPIPCYRSVAPAVQSSSCSLIPSL
jgi:hypothetical protein